jgi:hypothetical protein
VVGERASSKRLGPEFPRDRYATLRNGPRGAGSKILPDDCREHHLTVAEIIRQLLDGEGVSAEHFRTRKECHLVSCGRFGEDWTKPSVFLDWLFLLVAVRPARLAGGGEAGRIRVEGVVAGMLGRLDDAGEKPSEQDAPTDSRPRSFSALVLRNLPVVHWGIPISTLTSIPGHAAHEGKFRSSTSHRIV